MQEDKPSTQLMSSMIDTRTTLDDKMAASQLTLFKGAAAITSDEVDR